MKAEKSIHNTSGGQEYFFDIAIQDASSCLDIAAQTNLPRDQRSAVRAVFAFIDGCQDFIRRYVCDQAQIYSHAYSISELAVLHEETPYVDERGNVKVRPLRVPLITSIKVLVKLLEKNADAQHEVDLTHPGFSALQHSVEVRNRIVHPKCAADLDVSQTELQDVRAAFAWYLSFSLRMSYATNEVLKFLAAQKSIK